MSLIKNKVFGCFIFSFFCGQSVFADTTPQWYQHHAFLDGGFNVENFNQCRQLVKRCPIPKDHIFPDQDCIDKILGDNNFCQQTKKILNAIDFYYSGLSVEKVGKYVLIDAMSVADAQNNYYIVTESGYLVNTLIDPVAFNTDLSKKCAKKLDIITNFNKPKQITSVKGKDIFTAILSSRECVACRTGLCTKVNFIFSKSGEPSELQIKEDEKMCQR